MVNWHSTTEIIKDAGVFSKLIHVLLGLYIWEWFTSLDFDWDYISGRSKFKWPLAFYFLNRYCLLIALIGIAVALNVTVKVDCQSLYTFNALFGAASGGLASINLSLRTMAVWSQNRYVVIPLVVIILGHWSLLLHGVLLHATWDPVQGCVITSTKNDILAIQFVYSMVFDLIVLLLTAYKLMHSSNGHSRLITLIFGDGLVFFIIAFMANLTATIFMLLNLNPVMSIIANVPTVIATSIVACRAVRRLTAFTSQGVERFQASTNGDTLAFRSTNHSAVRPKITMSTPDSVQMDKFDDSLKICDYDASGKQKRSDEFDVEAQQISDEFKKHSAF